MARMGTFTGSGFFKGTAAQRKGIVVGKDEVVRNMNREIEKMVGNIDAGLAAVVLKMKGTAQEYTPVDKGILVNSAYTITPRGVPGSPGGKFPPVAGADEAGAQHKRTLAEQGAKIGAGSKVLRSVAQVGFSAVYALAVHENPNAGKNSGGQMGWKFLQRSTQEWAAKALPIIKAKAKV